MQLAVMLLSISNILLWFVVWKLLKDTLVHAIIMAELGLMKKFEQILDKKMREAK